MRRFILAAALLLLTCQLHAEKIVLSGGTVLDPGFFYPADKILP